MLRGLQQLSPARQRRSVTARHGGPPRVAPLPPRAQPPTHAVPQHHGRGRAAQARAQAQPQQQRHRRAERRHLEWSRDTRAAPVTRRRAGAEQEGGVARRGGRGFGERGVVRVSGRGLSGSGAWPVLVGGARGGSTWQPPPRPAPPGGAEPGAPGAWSGRRAAQRPRTRPPPCSPGRRPPAPVRPVPRQPPGGRGRRGVRGPGAPRGSGLPRTPGHPPEAASPQGRARLAAPWPCWLTAPCSWRTRCGPPSASPSSPSPAAAPQAATTALLARGCLRWERGRTGITRNPAPHPGRAS